MELLGGFYVLKNSGSLSFCFGLCWHYRL